MRLLWAVLGATACTAVAPSPPAAAPTAAGPQALRFAWPAAGTVQVKETVRRKGHTAEYAYELAWTPHPAGGFVIEQRQRRWTALDGVALAEDPTPAALAAAGFNEAVYPRMRIGAGGDLVELLDLEAIAAPLIERAQAIPALTDAERQEVAATMRSPAALSMLGAASRQKWHCWVGAWLDGAIVPGATATHTEDIPTVQDATARAEVTVHAELPELVGGRVLIRLSLDTTFDPASLLQAMRAVPAQALTARAQALQQEAVANISRAERQDHMEVLTDPATLMPRKALRRTAITVFDKSGVSLGTQKEQYLYVFDWGGG